MPDRFFLPESLALGPLVIAGPEAHHMAQVLRLKPGAEVVLFNGNGRECHARLDAVHKNQVDATIISDTAVSRERSSDVTIACPLPKGDRAVFLIEKLTELGVARYVPLRTQRSVVHPGDGKLDKLNRHVIEASKQCGRNVLMVIEPIMSWERWVRSDALPARRWLADASGILPTIHTPAEQKIAVALGPEGGWTCEELEEARHHGWQMVSFGPTILRIETAALAAAIIAFQG